MDDEHLKNTINVFLGKIQGARESLDSALKPSEAALYRGHVDEDDLRESYADMVEFIYPYLAELALRGIDMSAAIQQALGRKGPKPVAPIFTNFREEIGDIDDANFVRFIENE